MRNIWISLSCLVLLLAVSVGTAFSQSGKQRTPQIRPSNDRPAISVQNIVREVRHELITIPEYDVFDWLEGDVRPDGTVILRGETIHPTLKSEAEKRVGKIESVSKVVNELRVLPVSPMDDNIRVAVYRSLFKFDSPLMRYGLRAVPPIHILVENGRVTLKGIVANQMDRQLAEVAARQVPNTFDVKNELQVENPTNN